jgi:hypothetical protein
MRKTTKVVANANPVRVIVAVYAQCTKHNPYHQKEEGGGKSAALYIRRWGRVCMRGRKRSSRWSVVHGGVNKHELS